MVVGALNMSQSKAIDFEGAGAPRTTTSNKFVNLTASNPYLDLKKQRLAEQRLSNKIELAVLDRKNRHQGSTGGLVATGTLSTS